jgi:hypothetical protein
MLQVTSIALVILGLLSGAQGVGRLFSAADKAWKKTQAKVVGHRAIEVDAISGARGQTKRVPKIRVTFAYEREGQSARWEHNEPPQIAETRYPMGKTVDLFVHPSPSEAPQLEAPTSFFGFFLLVVGMILISAGAALFFLALRRNQGGPGV